MFFIEKIKNFNFKKLAPFAVVVLVLVFVFVATPHQALAGLGDSIGSVVVALLSWIFTALIYIFGNLLLKATEILIHVLSYSDFIHAPIVEKGWVVIRDTANIAITITLLLVAFFNLFKSKGYQYNSFLPKLIVAAILINFSKTITGFFIDVGQVFMMTFVNAFKDAAAGNLVYGFGIQDILSFREAASGGLIGSGAGLEVNNWSIMGAVVLGSLMVLVAFLIVLALISMMLWRILALWFIVLSSPIAFLGGIIPGGIDNQYGKKWWGELNKYVIMGPVVAFMLWLSLSVISQMTAEKHLVTLELTSAISQGTVSQNAAGWQAFANRVSGSQNMVDYLVTCGLLLATLYFAGKTGAKGASVAGNFMGKLEGAGKWLSTKPKEAAWNRAKSSYLGSGISALAVRAQGSKASKLMGFNKEYSADQAAKRRAIMDQKWGGKTGAREKYEWTSAMKKKKDMEEAGVFKNEAGMRSALDSSLASGDLKGAMAVMQQMSSKKSMTKTDAENFVKKFGDDERMLSYVNAFWDGQEAAGDKTVAFKRTVKKDEFGYKKRSGLDSSGDIKKTYGDMKTSEVGDAGTIKAVTSLDKNDAAGQEYINILADRNDLGQINIKQRQTLLKHMDSVLAADDQSDGGVIKDDGTRKNFVKLRNVLKGMEETDARGRYVNIDRNGMVNKNLVQAASSTSKGTYRVGNKFQGYQNELFKDTNIKGSTIPIVHTTIAKENPDYLKNQYKEQIKAEAEKGKKQRIVGSYQPTDVEKAIKKQVFANMDLNQQLGELSDIREGLLTGAALQNSIDNFEQQLLVQIEKSEVDVIDPATGKKYQGKDLVKEFEQSDTYKNIVRMRTLAESPTLTPEEQKSLRNAADSMIIDLRDSSNWGKIIQQATTASDPIEAIKNLQNTPAARQKIRRQTLVTSRKLKTSIDSLNGPQHLPPAIKGVFNKTSREARTVEKTIGDLEKISELVQSDVMRRQINDLKSKYGAYQNTTGQAKLDLVKEMNELTEKIINNFET